jgi:L-alanine-DL-glutamate epimerase-like enolase superfamily enzyme
MDADGMVHVPRDRPGLGVTVDEEFIESLTTRVEELRGTAVKVAV